MAAEPEDLPAGPLRDIAYRFPADTRALMSPLEMRLRAEYVHELQSRAASEPPGKAERTIGLAEKVIRSLSDYSFSAVQIELSDALAGASRRGDSQAAYEAMAELRALDAKNPRVPADRVVAHAKGVVVQAIENKLTIPPPPASNVFRRKRRG
jgi:hypothetical protein